MTNLPLMLVLFFSTTVNSCAQQTDFHSGCDVPDHAVWNDLLNAHVDASGWVSYKGFIQDSTKLNAYLKTLSVCSPSDSWAKDEKLAYWINAYNAFTVRLILDHYPLESIKDIKKGIPFINSVWDIKFFTIAGEKMDLNDIEHAILRTEFNEPRIHFAIVCASRSCPKLLNEAYTSEKLEAQLQQQAIDFINDPSKNRFQENEIELSPIFKWFKKDFTEGTNLKQYLAEFAKKDFREGANVVYTEYDWSLNGN